MINLLPPKDRLEIERSKHNSVLRRYIELCLLGILVLVILVAGSHYYLKTQESNIAKTAQLSKQKAEELSKTQEEAEQLAQTINTIGTLLARDVRFSSMLTEIGTLMPPGSVLTGLELSSTDSKAPLLITAQIDSEQKGAVLRNNLASSKLFDKAEIKSITRITDDEEPSASENSSEPPSDNNDDEEDEAPSPYSYVITLEAYFKPREK